MGALEIIAGILLGVAIVLAVALRRRIVRHHAHEFDLLMVRRELAITQEQLEAQRTYLTTLADAAFDAVFVVDAERRVTMINQAARQLFAVKEPAIGQTLMTLTRHHQLDALVASVLRGETFLENQIQIKDHSFPVRGARIPSRRRSSVVVVLQDISELLRLTRARREMVANISHDLGTPISNIRLLVDTLTMNFGRNAERDPAQLGKIAGATDSLEHMTRELLDLSMIESGQAIIRMVPVKFADVLRNAFNVMATQIEQKKLELITEVPDDLMVLVDPEQTRRVITNLLHNSVKFTPSRGQIKFTAIRSDQMATIRVTDTGPGIPPQDRTRIFERFYQVDTSRTGQAGGSGLGLAIAKHIIEAQGGKIWAEAGIPSGACIVFTIPLAESAKSAA